MRWIAACALLLASGCSSGDTDHDLPRQVSEIPVETEEHFLVCKIADREIREIVTRCVLSDIKADDLATTIERWGKAREVWNDHLFDTRSFATRYAINADERACLKSAFCREMEREELGEDET